MDTGKNQGHLRSLRTTTLEAGGSLEVTQLLLRCWAETIGREPKNVNISKHLNKPLFPLPAPVFYRSSSLPSLPGGQLGMEPLPCCPYDTAS